MAINLPVNKTTMQLRGGFYCSLGIQPISKHKESLLENLLGEHGEVDTPIAPDVAAVGLYILIFVAFGVPVVAQINGALIKEIGLTHTHPVEFGLAAEEAGRLPCKVGITLDLLRERLVHIEVLT